MAELATSAHGLQREADYSGGRDVALAREVRAPNGDARSGLMKTLEQQVIPRLVMAHCGDMYEAQTGRPVRIPPNRGEVEALAEAAVRHDTRHVAEMVEAMLRQGLSLESALLDYVGPAAAHLGAEWADDLRSWTDVTMGTGTLQRMVQVLSPSVAMPVLRRGLVLLMAAPGEQHTLGLHILAELLRREGWGVHAQPNLSSVELLGLVEREHVHAVGISASDVDRLEHLAELVDEVRTRSSNAGIRIVLGGSAEGLHDLARQHGIFHSTDARTALVELDGERKSGTRAVG